MHVPCKWHQWIYQMHQHSWKIFSVAQCLNWRMNKPKCWVKMICIFTGYWHHTFTSIPLTKSAGSKGSRSVLTNLFESLCNSWIRVVCRWASQADLTALATLRKWSTSSTYTFTEIMLLLTQTIDVAYMLAHYLIKKFHTLISANKLLKSIQHQSWTHFQPSFWGL